MNTTHSLRVALGARSYPIDIGAGLLDDAPRWLPLLRGRHVLVVSDANVAPHYLARVQAALTRHTHRALVLPAGEQEKTLHRFGEVLAALAHLGASRDATLIALGGGVIGDLSGFAAACWMRGIAFVQMPTTLLAMVDSSVGGKTAVDLASGKNLVGAFHQPVGVLADTNTLVTLPVRELRAGLAEVVKYGALGDAAFFDWLDAHCDALLACDNTTISEAIARSCAHKAAIVARDETEQGERALLNLGHTFGHAIEAEQGYGGLLHGEAVAVGMVLAARCSAALGLAAAGDGERLAALLTRFGLPTAIPPGLAAERLLARMRLDKKAVSGSIRLVLWHGIGQAFIAPDVAEHALLAVLRDT
ncbi:MAG: 3-dehydroquinate synthase [Lysobacterales bacterium CG17_big_fil_post_rev_8_21_14_2_50_64_11]|nr:MAG: 3-dehydroquinate synthase [Xanthomonadales bacterium CG17_big_fil_post_rev_8_21_14_2_50_64_11]PIX60083.1 MAG: 3-dehydroquinate synthase [Xanthomonadales bacterium CG_4_10_14_3_um_filter_64_11]